MKRELSLGSLMQQILFVGLGLLAQMSTHFNNADIQIQLIMDRFFGEFKIYIMTALNLCFKSKWVWMESSN